MLGLPPVVTTPQLLLPMNLKLGFLVLEFVYVGAEEALITHFNIYLT
jgi:hypothetical protein